MLHGHPRRRLWWSLGLVNSLGKVVICLRHLIRLRIEPWSCCDSLGSYTTPEHDEKSRSDAFGENAINCGIQPPLVALKPPPKHLSFTVTPAGAVVSNMTFNEII